MTAGSQGLQGQASFHWCCSALRMLLVRGWEYPCRKQRACWRTGGSFSAVAQHQELHASLWSSKSFETLQIHALVCPSSDGNQSWMSCLRAPFWKGSFPLEDETTPKSLWVPREQVTRACLCGHAVFIKRICVVIRRYETPCIFVGKVQVQTRALTVFSENKLLMIILLMHLQIFLSPNKPAPTEITCNTDT